MKFGLRVVIVLAGIGFLVPLSRKWVVAAEPATAPAPLRVREDLLEWRIKRPQISWRLDQKAIEQLRLSQEEVNQLDRSLRESIVRNLSAEAAVQASIGASFRAQSEASLNPIRVINGNRIGGRFVSESQVSGKLGASIAQYKAEESGESQSEKSRASIDIPFMRAIYEPRLQFSVTICNRSPEDLLCKNMVIPIWGRENILAQAVPVDEEGRKLAVFKVPANRPGGVDQLFVAKIAVNALWDFVNSGGLSSGLELRLERGAGQILAAAGTGEDLIAARAAALKKCVSVRVELPGGAAIIWYIDRGDTAARVMVVDALAAVNALLKKRLDSGKDVFCFEDGVLVSALGFDQYLSGWVWEVRADGAVAAVGEDLRPWSAGDSLVLRLRRRIRSERITPPRAPSDWSRLVAARQKLLQRQPPESSDVVRSIAERPGPWSAHAMNVAATMHQQGWGFEAEPPDAAKWYRRAAESEEPEVMFDFGLMYAEGRGVPKDEAEAVKWYRKSAEAGDPLGMVMVGAMYSEGRGVPKDEAEAVGWYRKSAEAGEPKGMFNLGIMYANGQGVPKDEAKAVKWYRKSAEAGEPKGMFNLGVMYAGGRGVPKDEVEAVKWYRKAAALGNSDAKRELQDRGL